jgi:hypothetical protein
MMRVENFLAKVHVVHVGDNGDAHFVDPSEIVHDRKGGDRVEGSDRLIGENQFGFLGEGAGQSDPLLLAAGELIRPDIGFIENAEFIEGLER